MVCVSEVGFASAVAEAATLDSVQGEVPVNRGSRLQPVDGLTGLNPGNTVMASPDGRAQIVYADGVAQVRPAIVVSFGETAPPPEKGGRLGGGMLAISGLVVAGVVGSAVGPGSDDDMPAGPRSRGSVTHPAAKGWPRTGKGRGCRMERAA